MAIHIAYSGYYYPACGLNGDVTGSCHSVPPVVAKEMMSGGMGERLCKNCLKRRKLKKWQVNPS